MSGTEIMLVKIRVLARGGRREERGFKLSKTIEINDIADDLRLETIVIKLHR